VLRFERRILKHPRRRAGRSPAWLGDNGRAWRGPTTEALMSLLKWALICLLISLVAGAFGYTGIARGAAQISKILFFVFIVLFLVILILAITAGELVF
jgi:uncharacterized membrane protein YtjA (UPF0391 family)